MVAREVERFIEEELQRAGRGDAAEMAADVAHLVTAGLVEVALTPAGELTIAPRRLGE